ncbi:DUF4430 domain-containing protein [Oceanobacillus sp. FSL H7-0719]|uniref:DUF4430 domain-containing protein n=1 Tax=Oceanobacillus sp. FSL H7-0719 TaxID=2954507 RepID=UPI0032459809
MRKDIFILLILGAIVTILAACSNNEEEKVNTVVSTNETSESDKVADNTVRITISMQDGAQFLNEQEVEIEKDANLLEVLQQTFFVETNDDGEVTSIERMKVDEEANTTWNLYVNDKYSDIPAKDYTLNGGEKIIFDLQ